MKLNKFAYLYSKPNFKSYFKNNGKNTWKFTKKPGKIMEKSWNFVSPKKWEPCKASPMVMVSPKSCFCPDLPSGWDYVSITSLIRSAPESNTLYACS